MLVSVIMPALNAEKYIGQSIQSALAQTYPQFELVVIDDGSTDNTARVIQSFRDPRVRYLHQENKGLPAARNAGIKAARGELIAFLDSDDLWIERKLEVQVATIQREGVDVVYSNGYVFYDDETTDESLQFANPEGHMRFGRIAGEEMLSFLFPINRIPVLSVLAQKQSLERMGLFDESLKLAMEDYDMWMRLARHGAVFFGIREPLVRYRIHFEAMSQKTVNMLRAEIAVFEKQRHTHEIDLSTRRLRLRTCYKNAITALIENGMIGEARKYLLRQLWRERFEPSILFQTVLITLMPKKYSSVYSFLNRIRESVSYRIGWRL